MRRFEQYALERGDNIGDPAFWNPRLQDVDDRINALEVAQKAVDNAVANVEALGVERVNATLNPLVAEALAKVSSIANLLEAGSASEVTIASSGQVSFTIAESDRTIWPLPSFVSASVVTDPTQYMAGRVVSFDRETGVLVVDVMDHGGAGTYASWVVRLSGMPGEKGDKGDQGDKGDPGDLSGTASDLAATAPSGFTGTNVQDVLASIAAVLNTAVADNASQDTAIAGKAPTYHTHGQGDVNGLVTALSGKAASVHSHAIADVSGLQTALDGKAGTSVANTFTKHQGFGIATLTDAATIAWDVSSAQAAKVTLGGNRTLGAPTNAIEGFTYVLIVKQDATGGRTLAFDASILWPDGEAPVIASGASKKTMLTFIYEGGVMNGVASLNY